MPPLLLGHRGTPRDLPENTLLGFQAALDAGLDGVELDVRRMQDGTLVVHHDAHLANGLPLPGLYAEGLPAQVPRLNTVLAWAADTGAFLNIELKFEGVAVDDRVVRSLDAVRAHGLGRRVLLSSFHPLQLAAARRAAPEIERGLLIHRRHQFGPLDLVPNVMRWVDAVALHPHHSLIDGALVAQARRRGWQVNAWTVNEPSEARRLLDLGVDGLIGDVPGVLLEAADRRA